LRPIETALRQRAFAIMSLPQILDPYLLAAELAGRHLIDGQLTASASGRGFAVLNPATQEVFAHAAEGDARDVDRAVNAACAAQPAWARMPARKRGEALAAAAALIDAHAEEIGRLLALESGKALRTESRLEPPLTADCLRYYAGLASELKGQTVPFDPAMLVFTQHEPIGVVGAILPWNVPLLLMAFKIAPALAAGNAVVVKSAEETPFAALRVVQLMNEVLPKGVLNIVSGDGPSCGAPLASHPKVGKLTFTGSVETGKLIAHAAAEKLIPVTLELGGKSPMIVMADADLDKAVAGAVAGMRFTRQGQSCTAASRMLVHASLVDRFMHKLKEQVGKLKMGDPLAEDTDIGAVISQAQAERVHSYIALGLAHPGATAHRLCARPAAGKLANGFFIEPVVFTGIPNDHRVAQEEIFGPVSCVIPFDTAEQAIALANDSSYGLAATVWTKDLATAMQATQQLQAGFVQVNQNMVARAGVSYGGFKQSGLGKEAAAEVMAEHFMRKKTVLINMN
jgi:acyl-CoA reductase-like NAD-dependent aldehyde dehydrogenase